MPDYIADYTISQVYGDIDYSEDGNFTTQYDAKLGGGGTVSLQPKTLNVSANGNYTVAPDAGYGGLSGVTVVVSVPQDEPTLQDKTITANGAYTADSGYDGLGTVTVNVPGSSPALQAKSATVTANGQISLTPDTGYDGLSAVTITVNVTPTLQAKTAIANGTVTPDSGYDGLSQVTVNVPTPSPTLQDKTITANGDYSADSGYDGLGTVTVNVPDSSPTLQAKSATPTKAAQEITPDSGYDGLSKVTVGAIPSQYIDTSDATATAAEILSGKTAYVGGSKLQGTYSPPSPTLQDKTVTDNGSVTADSGYDGLGTVTVNVPTSGHSVATGSISGGGSATLSLSGLSFTPTSVMMWCDFASRTNSRVISLKAFSSATATTLYISGLSAYSDSTASVTYGSGTVSISSEITFMSGTWHYAAWN